jgi:hypothetical protein
MAVVVRRVSRDEVCRPDRPPSKVRQPEATFVVGEQRLFPGLVTW